MASRNDLQLNTASVLHFNKRIDWRTVETNYVVAEHRERHKNVEGGTMHARIVSVDKGAVKGTNMPCFLVPRTGFFVDPVQRDLDLIANVNRTDVGSGAKHRSTLTRENDTRKSMGKQSAEA